MTAVDPNQGTAEVLTRIGKITRGLQESLLTVGCDKVLELAAISIPDARERLAYVANMSERAAERTLNATEMARPIQERLAADATSLASRWDNLFAAPPGVADFKALVVQTRQFLERVPTHTYATNVQLTEIMLAQDFQDLTGQVITKINEIVHQLENELMKLLRENLPAEKHDEAAGLLASSRLVSESKNPSTQKQVDEIISQLGPAH